MIKQEYRQHFCKAYNIPIKVFSSPVFESRIELLDELYGTVALAKSFEKDIKRYRSAEACIADYNKIKDSIVEYIKSKPEYEEFVNSDFSKFQNVNLPSKRKNLYVSDNDGKYFLGFDLSQANYNSLRFFNKNLVDNTKKYEEFIKQFTDLEYFINSKYIRQVVCGLCTPTRQNILERYIMSYVYAEIIKKYQDSDIVHFSDDELILSIKEDTELEEKVKEISKGLGFPIRIEKYKLVKVSGADVYFKVFNNNKYSVKCATNLIIPFVARAVHDDPINELDKQFAYEGYTVKFVDCPKIFVPLLKY